MDVRTLAAYDGFSDQKLAKHNLFGTDRLFLDVYCLRPGQAQKPHAHDGADKVYVGLEGTCRVTVGGEAADLGPGQAVLAPAGVVHGVANEGAVNARLLVFLSPPPKHA